MTDIELLLSKNGEATPSPASLTEHRRRYDDLAEDNRELDCLTDLRARYASLDGASALRARYASLDGASALRARYTELRVQPELSDDSAIRASGLYLAVVSTLRCESGVEALIEDSRAQRQRDECFTFGPADWRIEAMQAQKRRSAEPEVAAEKPALAPADVDDYGTYAQTWESVVAELGDELGNLEDVKNPLYNMPKWVKPALHPDRDKKLASKSKLLAAVRVEYKRKRPTGARRGGKQQGVSITVVKARKSGT